MDTVSLLMLFSMLCGLIVGISSIVGIRWLRRWGATQALVVNPQTGRFREEWRRPASHLLRVGKGKDAKHAPLGLGKTWTHEVSGRQMLILDGHAGVAMDVDPDASLLLHPNGGEITAVLNSESEKKFRDEPGMDIRTLAIIVAVGFLFLGGFLVYIITQLGKGVGGVASG
jgi:hypothetical protein